MSCSIRWRCFLGYLAGIACWGLLGSICFGQTQVKIETQAASGKPFGVGKMTVNFPTGRGPAVASDQPLWLSDAGGRALYPAFKIERGFSPTPRNDSSVDSVTAYFLFRGEEPLDLTLDIDDSHHAQVAPGSEPAKNDQDRRTRLLDEWWRLYTASARRLAQVETYPSDIENYLVAMLGPRLALPVPDIPRKWSGRDDVDSIFGTLLGAESVRLALQKETLLQQAKSKEKADQPLPVPAAMPSITIPLVPGKIDVEPIALHVPAECFYVRCGKLSNFQWLRATIDDWGGDLRTLVAVRGVDYDIRTHLERQLSLRESVLSRLLGDAVIGDVALIGNDTFFREGAAVGVLFQARNNALLAAQIAAQRKATLDADKSAAEKTVDIAGRQVSLLSTTNNTVRSFYAVDGDYHLVTTSQAIVRRFFEAGAGRDALGALPEFRYARTLMPLARNDTAFVYLSDPFFRMMVSPRYRVEMTRRMQGQAEIGLVELARLAAKAEKQPAESIDQLMAGGFLPDAFGDRADGSRTVLRDGNVVDSLRGARTAFLPVPDVELSRITPTERASYDTFAEKYAAQWRRVDPVIIGVRREVQPRAAGDRERVVLDVHITPYARQHYAFYAGFLAPPDNRQLQSIPGNVIEGEVRLNSLLGRPISSDHRLFGGLRDFVPEFGIHDGQVIVSRGANDSDVPIYAGETPPALLRGWLPENNAPKDADGYEHATGGTLTSWRRTLDEFFIAAQQKDILEAISPHLKVGPAERPAQLRLRVGDLAQTKWSRLLEAYAYVRARTTSAGDAQFLNALMQQFQVEADACPAAAEAVLGAKLVCPLGGKLQPNLYGPGPVSWKSTAWGARSQSAETRVPKDYRSPLLDWFHGLNLEFSIDATTLSTRIELELQPKPAAR